MVLRLISYASINFLQKLMQTSEVNQIVGLIDAIVTRLNKPQQYAPNTMIFALYLQLRIGITTGAN